MPIRDLVEFVMAHTDRGECQCGRCIDKGAKPNPQGHTADMTFFKVAARDNPSKSEFERLVRENRMGSFNEVDPFDGAEHGYQELGAWIGDQGLAICFMALGGLLGVFDLLTPEALLGAEAPVDLKMQMAQAGMLSIMAKKVPAKT